MTTEEKCENCRYYISLVYFKKDRIGKCRRYPPQLFSSTYTNEDGAVTSSEESLFPEVCDEWFCGEFKEKKA